MSRYSEEEPFHSKMSVYQVIGNQQQSMLVKIQTLSEQQAKSKSLDDLADGFVKEFSINVPILDEDKARPESREVDIEPARYGMRGDYGFGFGFDQQGTVKGTEISITVPFTGDAEVFRIHANSHTMDYPLGRIDRTAIVFSRKGQNLDGTKVRAEFDAWLASIKRHLAGIRGDLVSFDQTLRTEALRAIKERLSKFSNDSALLNSLGFKSV